METVLPHTTPHHIMRLVNSAGNVLLVNDPATTEFGWGRKHGFIQPEVDRALLNGLRRFDGHSPSTRWLVVDPSRCASSTWRGLRNAQTNRGNRC
ncbi:hypothetical protein [Mycobacterium sp. URHB0044]|uniref:hypothetical protein n=1 Tax=Mycobacterium sp. URHB0044 TaxID=1380386 RepID=UPI000491DFC9|nr:hypothetical protein [Mycobacterium sp. URHB0044]